MDKHSLLISAIRRSNAEEVKNLLDSGVDMIGINLDISPFACACTYGNPKIIKMFLDMKCDPNDINLKTITLNYLLYNRVASMEDTIQSVYILLEAGAIPDSNSIWAAEQRNMPTVIIDLLTNHRKRQDDHLLKQSIHLRCLKDIPQVRHHIRLNPDSIGFKIVKCHFENSAIPSNIIDYLGINTLKESFKVSSETQINDFINQ